MADRPGLFARARAAVTLLATGKVDDTSFFGPLEPLRQTAPSDVAGRRFDYPMGYNIVPEPRGIDHRGESRVPFWQLRALADNYDLLRLVIETRKDQLAKLEWSVQAKDEEQRKKQDNRIDRAKDFLEGPDGEHSWDVWVRALAEEMLVVDAATIYPRRTRGGDLLALDLVDGASIKPVIDDHGRRPAAPLPAYQQILKGLPAVDYSAGQLYYLPRNWRAAWVYGLPPVEQIIMTVNIALRRQVHLLAYYTEGTVPDALAAVPDNWNIDQIAELQAYWDSLLTDNSAQRRKLRFVPGATAKGMVFTKEAALKDETDEWLARIVCYALNVSSQWATKQMNRATAESAQEQALQEGLFPLKVWVKSAIDRCLADGFGWPDLEFVFNSEDETEPEKQNLMLDQQLKDGVITVNEFRGEIGRESYPAGIGDKPMVYTASGWVLLESVQKPPEPAVAPGAGGDEPGGDPPPGTGSTPGRERAHPDLAKGAQGTPLAIPGAHLRAASDLAVFERSPRIFNGVWPVGEPCDGWAGMAKAVLTPDRPQRAKTADTLLATWATLLQAEGKRIAAELLAGRKLAKAEGGEGEPDIELDIDAWSDAEQESREALEEMAVDGAGAALGRLGLATDDLTKLANPLAVEWAKDHAAEFVSQVSDTTKARLNDLVAQSESEGWAVAKLAGAIESDDAFSPARAQRIALHETRTADNQGARAGMKAAKSSGVAIEKDWEPRGGNVCAACDENSGNGWIELDDEFSSGDDCSPMHPGCECDTEYRVKKDEA